MPGIAFASPITGRRPLVCAVAAAFVLSACGGGSTGQQSDGTWSISIVASHYPTLLYSVPWIVGQDKGFFEDEGITITEIIGGAGGGSTLRNALAGDVPFAEVSANAATEGWLEDIPLVAVAGGAQNLSEARLVPSPDSGITSIEDLQNYSGTLRWGFSNPGSTTEAAMYVIAEELGLEIPGNIEPVATGGVGEAVPLLAAGDIDMFPLSDPIYSSQEENLEPPLGSFADVVPWFQQSFMITTPEVMEEDPELVSALLRAYGRSVDFIYENPEESAELYAEVSELPVEATLPSVLNAVDYEFYSRGGIREDAMTTFTSSLEMTSGITDVPWNEVFDTRFLDELELEYPAMLADGG